MTTTHIDNINITFFYINFIYLQSKAMDVIFFFGWFLLAN